MKQRLLLFLILLSVSFSVLNAQDNRKPLQIADEFSLNLSSTKDYFQNKTEGIVYRKVFSNKGSAYIKLHINSFDLNPGDYLKVYAKNGEEYIYSEKGKIVGENKEMISEFWTGTIWSDNITLEIYSTGNNTSHYGFNIDRVAYGHTPAQINAAVEKLDNPAPNESICSADNKEAIVCYDGTEMGRKAKAVCRLLINGGGLCTGWLLGCDGNVMTNNHCIGDAAAANNTDFMFNYQYDNCAGTVNATSDLQATSSTFIQTSGSLDFTLVKLPVNPTPIYGYLSLSSTIAAVGDRIYIPQHPGGRRKEIAVNTDVGGDANGFAMITGVGGNGNRVTYQCDTEGGSSGSPVLKFDTNLVVAIHNTGGCPNGANGRSDEMIAAIAANMPPCGVDDNNPDAPYVSANNTIQPIGESTDCNYTEIPLTIRIATPATQNADVTISPSGGTATNNVDFELVTTSVTFLAGDDTNKTAIIRVFNDAFVEGDETITLDITLNANGGDAQLSSQNQFDIIINDDDYNPNIGGLTTYLSDDFENGLGNFTVTGSTPSVDFVIGNSGTSSSQYFDTSANTTNFAYVNDDTCNCDMLEERLTITAPFDLTNAVEAYLNFDYMYNDTNDQYNNDAFVQVSTDSGATWTSIDGDFTALTNWDTRNVNLSAYAGQSNIMLSILFSDDGNWSYGLAIDNLTVTGLSNATIQSTVNSGDPTALALTASGTLNAYDNTSRNVIATINNTDNSDYGCLDISVSRAGSSGQPFNGSIAPALVTDKTFTITPTVTNATGTNTISFYFTEAEIAGWETATSDSRNNLKILKDNGTSTENVSGTLTSFGSDHILTGDFTSGLNGTYYFGNIAFLSTNEFSFDDFALFPNPTNGMVNVRFNTTEDVAINLYDIRGRSVYNNTFNQTDTKFNQELNFNALSAGIYVIKINSGTHTMFKKLVIR